MQTLADTPTLTVVRSMADRLGVSTCYLLRGELHLPLGQPGWTIAVKPDSAGRVRVCTCEYARPHDMKWTTTTDRERHSRLVDDSVEVMVNEQRERARGPV